MAENETDQSQVTEQAANEPSWFNSPLFARLKIAGIVVAIVAAECAGAYVLIPDAAQVEAMAETRNAEKGEAPIEPTETPETAQIEPIVEVPLEQYGVTAFQPASNTTLRLDFQLYGTVLEKDHSDFEIAFEKNKHRIRDQVIITARNSEVTDLTDAGLGLIKRQILEKINQTLGKPYLQTIVFSDFSFVEE